MQGFEITLESFGAFVIPCTEDADCELRITFDRECPKKPWIVLEQQLETGRWERAVSFSDLDAAFAWAVHAQTGRHTASFTVRLPCGRHFSRPGRIPAEQVLASMGWIYATHLTGFTKFVAPADTTKEEARAHFLSMIAHSSSISLGDVWLDGACDETSRELWIAELDFQFEGFIHNADIELEKDVSFTSEGIPLILGYDVKARKVVTPAEADVIDFASMRERKMLKAA